MSLTSNDSTKETSRRAGSRAGKAVTLEMVAKSVGITKTAASYALSGKNEVSEATRARVLQAARELGYRPNPHAQRLSSGLCKGMVGIYSSLLDLGVATLFVSELHNHLQNQGCEAPIYTYGHYRGVEGDYRQLLNALCRQRPEGIICNGATQNGKPLETDILEEYQSIGGTVVCVHSSLPGLECDHVIFDRDENTYQAAKVLLEAGHRDIGFCTYGVRNDDEPRRSGFLRALAEYNITPQDQWFFEAEERETGGVLLAEQFLGLEKRPTGLCIVNDTQAATFVHQLSRAGMSVPDDVSVVSLDGLPAAEYGLVRLTSVSHPFREMAATATEWMKERLHKTYTGEPRKIAYAGEVIERESVRNLN